MDLGTICSRRLAPAAESVTPNTVNYHRILNLVNYLMHKLSANPEFGGDRR
jgi:hypothetical protein